MASFNDSAGRLKIYAKLLLTGKHKGSWPKDTSRESVDSKFMGATCLSEELGRLKKKKNAWMSSRFVYRVFTGPFSYFKLANSYSSRPGV